MSAATYYPVNSEPDHQQQREVKAHTSRFHTFDLDTTSQHNVGAAPLPLRTATRRPVRQTASNIWLWELSCWLFALACFIAIVAVLYIYNGKPAPNLKFGITLATMISLLSSVATFSLVVPLEAGLGQLKWLWFRKARPISDFEVIEGAAGGPPGSAALLARGKGGVLAWSGALLTILILAISPFIQQIVATDFRAVARPGASLPIAVSYKNSSDRVDIDLPMRAAIQSGLLVTGNSTSFFNPPSQCPTGNCTFPTTRSLAVCGSCADLTAQIQTQDDDSGTTYSLPNGLSLLKESGVAGVSMTLNNTVNNGSIQTISFPTHNNEQGIPLADVFVIIGSYNWDGGSTKMDRDMGPYAAECILELCVQEYASASTNGTFTQNTTGQPIPFDAGQANYDVVTDADGTSNGIYYLTTDNNTSNALNYTVGMEAMNGLQTYLSTLFLGLTNQYNSLSSSQTIWPNDVSQAIYTQLNSSSHTLDTMFDNIAASMTLNMRTGAESQPVRGEALYQEPIVVVRWAWMALPGAILVLSLVFVLVVALQTRRAGLEPWKSSSTATLFALHGLQATDMMEQEAGKLYVRLMNDATGGKKLERVS